MNDFKYKISMATVYPPTTGAWLCTGEGDTFGQAVADLISGIEENTGTPLSPDGVGDIIDTALEAWIGRLTGSPMLAQRREFSDCENNFDLEITEN